MASKTTILKKPAQDGKPASEPLIAPVSNAVEQIANLNAFSDVDAEVGYRDPFADLAREERKEEAELRAQETKSRLQRDTNLEDRERRFRDQLGDSDIELPDSLGANPNETIRDLADFFDEVNNVDSETAGTVELSTFVPRASSTLQSANALSQAVDRQVSLERETAVPNLLAMLRTDLLYPKSETEFQALVDNMAKLEIQRQMAPDFPEAQEQAGQFLGLLIDLAAFRGDVVGFLSLINEVRLAVARVRETLTEENSDGASLAATLLERLNYDTSIDLDTYPTSFLVDCLLTDAFGTAVLGNVTSQKLAHLPALDLGLRSTTGALRFDRGLDMDLPSPYPTERNANFGDFTYANPDSPTENKPNLPQILGGQLNANRLFRQIRDLDSRDKITRTDELVRLMKTGETALVSLARSGNRFRLLSPAEKSRAILDPIVREVIVSRQTFGYEPLEFTTGPLSGLKGFELFNKIQDGLLGEFVSIRDNTTAPYKLGNESEGSIRQALQTSTGDLVFENSSITRKEKPLLARPVSEVVAWASLSALKGGSNREELLRIQSDVNSAHDVISSFSESISEMVSPSGEDIVASRIMPCLSAMFAWADSVPTTVADGTDIQTNAEYYRRLRTPNTSISVDGTELLPGGRNFGFGSGDLSSIEEEYRVFDLVMQEMFDRAYVIDGGDVRYKEALQLIVRYRIMKSVVGSSFGENTSYGSSEITRNTRASEKIIRSFRDRFGANISLSARSEGNLAESFAFLAAVKDITNSGPGRGNIEEEITGSDGINAGIADDFETWIQIDLSNRSSDDFVVSTEDGEEIDLLSPFGTLESFESSLRNNPAVLAAYVSLIAPPTFPRDNSGLGLNVADMTARWVDKFLELNSDCFDTSNDGNPNFTRSFPYSLEHIISIATRVAVEGILASGISVWGGFNRYEAIGTLPGVKRKTWRPISTGGFDEIYNNVNVDLRSSIDSYVSDVAAGLTASLDDAYSLSRDVDSLRTKLRAIKDRINELVEATEQPDRFPYLRALSSASSNGFAGLLLDSMTSGYSTMLALCNTGFSTETNGSEQRAGELPMTILRGGITQADALAMSSLLSASGLVGTQTESVKRSGSRVRTLCIGIPNGFMSTAESSDFFVPILSNAGSRLRSQVKSDTFNEIDYRYVELKVRRRDLRFAGDTSPSEYGGNVSTAVSIDWPVDLRIIGSRRVNPVPNLRDFRGRLQQSYGRYVADTDPYFIRTLLKNFAFNFGKFDLHTGELLQRFAVGPLPDDDTVDIPAAIRNMITSYGLKVFYVESAGISFDETAMVSDKRFFSAAIPTDLVPAVKAEARRLYGITENEIESVLERNSSFELGVSRRLVKFTNVANSSSAELTPRQRLVLAYVLSAANKLQVSDGFLRSISPKAFDQVAYIPIDVATGGFDPFEGFLNRKRSNASTPERFKYTATEDNSIVSQAGGDLFNNVGPNPPETFDRPLGGDKPLNVTLPCEFWVEIYEEEL